MHCRPCRPRCNRPSNRSACAARAHCRTAPAWRWPICPSVAGDTAYDQRGRRGRTARLRPLRSRRNSAPLHGGERRRSGRTWTTYDGRYDLWLIGPNGFHRHYRGDLDAAPLLAEIAQDPDDAQALCLTLRNPGKRPLHLALEPGAYTQAQPCQHLTVAAGVEHRVRWSATSTGGWHDLWLVQDGARQRRPGAWKPASPGSATQRSAGRHGCIRTIRQPATAQDLRKRTGIGEWRFGRTGPACAVIRAQRHGAAPCVSASTVALFSAGGSKVGYGGHAPC